MDVVVVYFRTVAVAYLSRKKRSTLMLRTYEVFVELENWMIYERSSMPHLFRFLWSRTTWRWHCSISIVVPRTGNPGDIGWSFCGFRSTRRDPRKRSWPWILRNAGHGFLFSRFLRSFGESQKAWLWYWLLFYIYAEKERGRRTGEEDM